MDFVFITDTHFTTSSNVRTGNLLDDLIVKFDFVIDYCNKYNAILLLGGDVFDKPSVPDMVKNRVLESLSRLQHECYAINGNHDCLYNNDDFKYKTSYATLVASGLIKDITNTFVNLDDCVISSILPVRTFGKPHIVLYHGLLNMDDGRWTFRYTDIESEDQLYVCLGHDHTVYSPIEFKNAKIFRPGSFIRGIREDASKRIPELLHIRCTNGRLQHRMVPIQCRDWQEIFQSKEFKVSKPEKQATYEDIISQIRSAGVTDLTFEDALSQVAEQDVVSFTMKALNESRNINQFKRQNL